VNRDGLLEVASAMKDQAAAIRSHQPQKTPAEEARDTLLGDPNLMKFFKNRNRLLAAVLSVFARNSSTAHDFVFVPSYLRLNERLKPMVKELLDQNPDLGRKDDEEAS